MKSLSLCLCLFIFAHSVQSAPKRDLPSPLPISSQQISFALIPHEPGPEWECIHKEIANLPFDWRVYCKSLNSGARAEFLVHFLVRPTGAMNSILEVLYWVDEYVVVNSKIVSLSHGQSSLIALTGSAEPLQLSLGQFVQNGTSSLNIIYSNQVKRRP